MRTRLAAAITSAALAFVTALPAAADDDTSAAREKALAKGGAWHYKSFACVDTKIVSVGTRLEDGETHKPIPGSGTVAEYATTLGFTGLNGTNGKPIDAEIVRYDTNPIMAKEKVGDRVQVCHLSTPIPDEYCKNPDTDTRGREYRVYDYRQHAAYSGYSSEHNCGGA